MSYAPYYGECFITAKVKKVSDTDGDRYVLDLPFPITSHQVIYNGKNYYHLIPEQDGIEVLAHITYFIEDDKKVKEYTGYIADNSTDSGKDTVIKHASYSKNWFTKNSEAKAISQTDKDGKDTIIPYTGIDKDELSIASVHLIK